MSKHTPGPWMATIETCDIEGVSCRYTIDSDREIRIAYGQTQEHMGGIDGDTIRANARLIAAAPDMLAALIALRDEYKQAIAALHMQSSRQLAWANADAVIAKATGGES